MTIANATHRFGFAASLALLMSTAAFVWPAAAASGPTMAQFRALEARVQKTEDVQAITQLIMEYGHTLDTHDLEGYSNNFAKDGEWIGGFGRAKGPAAILDLMHKYIGTAPADPTKVRGYHMLTNVIIHVDGDHATALSKLTFFGRNPDDKPAPVMGGHYDDTLIRENGQWKFLRRVVMMDIPYQDPRLITTPPPPRPMPGP